MFLDSKEATARELISAIRKTFAGPQDSNIADKLLAVVERDMLSQAAGRLADKIQEMASEVQQKITELQPQLTEARAAWEQAESEATKAESAFIGSFAAAQAAGSAVPESMFSSRSSFQADRQNAKGRFESLRDQNSRLSRRAGKLGELIGTLRAIQPAQPEELRSLIENSRFWRG